MPTGCDEMRPFSREDFDLAVHETWRTLAALDLMPGSADPAVVFKLINPIDVALMNVALDRRADFWWDAECQQKFRDVREAFNQARLRWSGRHQLYLTIAELALARADAFVALAVASKHYDGKAHELGNAAPR